MRIGRCIGTVTLSQAHPALAGLAFRLATPLSAGDLTGDGPEAGEPFVVCDELGAGHGSLIAIAEGPEAANPFRPAVKPLDAYNAAILDRIDVEPPK